jgi:hypothetical protein
MFGSRMLLQLIQRENKKFAEYFENRDNYHSYLDELTKELNFKKLED